MTRYTLHVPVRTNDCRNLRDLHEHVRTTLAASFDGFTAIDAEGFWRMPQGYYVCEDVRLYVIDVPDTSDAFARLHALATYVKREAAQDAVYLTRSPIETFLI